MGDQLLEIVTETKLLGTCLNADLTWWNNINYLARKGYQRIIIGKLVELNVPVEDLVLIFILYVRSILEFNFCVWTFNITQA